jgi:hypothetical protein
VDPLPGGHAVHQQAVDQLAIDLKTLMSSPSYILGSPRAHHSERQAHGAAAACMVTQRSAACRECARSQLVGHGKGEPAIRCGGAIGRVAALTAQRVRPIKSKATDRDHFAPSSHQKRHCQ